MKLKSSLSGAASRRMRWARRNSEFRFISRCLRMLGVLFLSLTLQTLFSALAITARLVPVDAEFVSIGFELCRERNVQCGRGC